LAYITSIYTYINISQILSQHIYRIDIINTHQENTHVDNIRISKYVYSYIYIYIYIYRPIRPSECLHTKIHVSTGQCSTSVQKPAHQPINHKNVHHTPLMGPLSPHHLLLPQEEGVSHHHLPQAVVEDHPQDPPAPAAGIH
jgi:hypothetical protein